ncbi:MAG: DUF4167 domain-containing protein [Gemmobacter sp.]
MRSSKSRSRSKANRPRTLGNIINRVFESSGPEGKVRGTPQQIIEKYLILARDAQLSNDRVAAENFQQHAEHYTRMLGEATREMAMEQESRQGQGNQNQGGQNQGGQRRDDRDGNWQQGGSTNGGGNGGGNGTQGGERRDFRPDYRSEVRNDGRNDGRSDMRPDPRPDPRNDGPRGAGDVIDLSSEAEGHLVETPESRATRREQADQPTRQTDRQSDRQSDRRRDAQDRPAAEVKPAEPAAQAPAAPAPAAEAPAADAKPKPPRRPRTPRKPRDPGSAPGSDGGDTPAGDANTGPREAAE